MTSRINANLSSIVLIFRYMGGVGTGTSWFDTPAQPSDSPTCNVFGTWHRSLVYMLVVLVVYFPVPAIMGTYRLGSLGLLNVYEHVFYF